MAAEIQEKKERPKYELTFPMVYTAFGAYIGGPFIYGYNIGCLNIPGPTFIKASILAHYGKEDDAENTITTMLFSIIVLLFCAGGAIGTYTSGPLMNKVGRRRAVLVSLILTLLGTTLITISKALNAVEVMMLGRLLIGIGAGCCFACVPTYTTEIAPWNHRGAFGATSQLFITIGIFVATCLTLQDSFGSELLWPVGVGAQAFFCLVSAIVLLSPAAQESPKWLFAIKKDIHATRRQLRKLYKLVNVEEIIVEELQNEQSEGSAASTGERWSLWKFLSNGSYRWPIILVITLNACQQLCGINVVFFYADSLYKAAGLVGKEVSYATLVVSAINVISTIVCVLLMDRLGRRKLLLPPMTMLCLSVVAQMSLLVVGKADPTNKGLAWGCIITLVLFVIGFAVGLAPIPNFVANELFDSERRADAAAIGGTSNLISTLTVALLFENVLLRFLGPFSFFPFLVITVAGLILFFFKLPETKGRSVPEIMADPRLSSCVFRC